MLNRILAAGAFVALTATAQAGTLQNGTWTATGCGTDPGAAPTMDGKNQKTYNASAKDFTAWQDKAKAYIQCATAEAQADSNVIVGTANKMVTGINDASKQFVSDANAAMEILKKKAGTQSH
jgi:hypothetical protein